MPTTANPPIEQRTEQRDVPAGALRFAADFELGKLAEGDGESRRTPIKMVARSAKPITHWYWGQVIHDMAGFKTHKPRLPVDYCHDDADVLGYLDEFDAGNKGLITQGEMISVREGDRADEVRLKGQAGVPYEASIFFDPYDLSIEEVGPGVKTKVNGYTVTGPALIFRKWSLRGVAVCPYGMDKHTKSQFASGHPDTYKLSIHKPQEPTMSTTADTATPTDDKTTQQSADHAVAGENVSPAGGDGKQTTPTPETKQSADKPTAAATAAAGEAGSGDDQRAKWSAELKRYTDRFGAEQGTKWFTEGKTWAEALDAHNTALSEQITAKDKELAAKDAKLSAVDRGEQEPAQFADGEKGGSAGGGESSPGDLKCKIGENLARFANGIKMPGAK